MFEIQEKPAKCQTIAQLIHAKTEPAVCHLKMGFAVNAPKGSEARCAPKTLTNARFISHAVPMGLVRTFTGHIGASAKR